MTEFKRGDVVHLKSGGIPMSVAEPDDSERVFCQWLNELGDYQSASFCPELLSHCGDMNAVYDELMTKILATRGVGGHG